MSARHIPEKVDCFPARSTPADLGDNTLYALLCVAEDCDDSELRAAYKQRALEEHPDKGGDQERFDEITRAYGILEKEESRDAYDVALARARDTAGLVQGAPERPREDGDETEKKEDLRKKTAPRVGSTRNKDWNKCGEQWIGEKSGGAMLTQIRLAIADESGVMAQPPPDELGTDQTDASRRELPKKQQDELVEALWEKFITLNPGIKKQWLSTLTGKQKQSLKDRAKVEEAKAVAKNQAWLSGKKGGKK